ncbi:unnamed protein product, partial [marine sediment metagenome]
MSTDQMKAVVENSTWCGFSIDSGSAESFRKIHRVDKFDKVIENLRLLVKLKKSLKSNVEITYKYLLHPLNANEIYDAAKLAKEIGCDMFQARPVCWDNLYGQEHNEPINYKPVVKIINDQITRASKLEGDGFHFHGIRHKFGPNFERMVNFEKCR